MVNYIKKLIFDKKKFCIYLKDFGNWKDVLKAVYLFKTDNKLCENFIYKYMVIKKADFW